MWKIGLGFVVFAALALFVLSKGGDIDMGGEKQGETSHMAESAAGAPPLAAIAPSGSSSADTANSIK